jgi:hypothetical protein
VFGSVIKVPTVTDWLALYCLKLQSDAANTFMPSQFYVGEKKKKTLTMIRKGEQGQYIAWMSRNYVRGKKKVTRIRCYHCRTCYRNMFSGCR